MQVFISDIHFVDEPSDTTIKKGALELFRDNLKKLVQDVKKTKKPIKELKIVLLGDIFDVIRSTKWNNSGYQSIRPWSDPSTAQEAAVQNIVDDIINKNQQSLKCFDDLRRFAVDEEKIPFQIQYAIGNHDWLINRYPKVMKTVADALGITDVPTEFPTEIYEPAYGIIARHGDKYDKLNYMGDRNKSSIGDAIVIELLNKFPEEVRKALEPLPTNEKDPDEKKRIVDKLKEIDNVRPLTDIPSWLLMVSKSTSPAIQKEIRKVWFKCVDEFFDVPFVKNMSWFSGFSRYGVRLRIYPYIPKFILGILCLPTLGLQCLKKVRYNKKAWAEVRNSPFSVRYILYGHTHKHLMVSMDQVTSVRDNITSKIYFNTGTWRQTWNKAVFDRINKEFIGWKVLTYIAFYSKEENSSYKFEVWNGALG